MMSLNFRTAPISTLFLNVGKHMLVAQSGKGVGRYVAAQRLYSIYASTTFGDPNAWSQDRFELDGLENIIDHFLSQQICLFSMEPGMFRSKEKAVSKSKGWL